MTTETQHLSVSQAKSCLARTGFRKILGLTEPSSEAMEIGSRFHAAVEAFWRDMATAEITGEKGEVKRLFDAYTEFTTNEFITPEGIEQEFKFILDGMDVIGFIDLIYTREDLAGKIIGDYKTKSERSAEKDGNKVNADELLQLAVYAHALQLPLPVKGEIHNIVKAKKPWVYITEIWIDQRMVDMALDRLRVLIEAYRTLHFRPEPSWKCEYCAFWERCQGGDAFDGNFNNLLAPHMRVDTKGVIAMEQVIEAPGRAVSVPEKSEVSVEAVPPSRKRYIKLALIGEHGTLKTRTALQFPRPRVIDTEFGTDHYQEEFGLQEGHDVFPTTNINEVDRLILELAKTPTADTLIIDSFTLYCDAVTSYFISRYQVKEVSSKGNKGDYYTLQPRDYQPINEYLNRRMRMLLNLRCNVILTCHVKDEYDDLKKTGNKLPDAFKKMVFYMDTVIYLKKSIGTNGELNVMAEVEKDRTHCLPARFLGFGIDYLREKWAKYFAQHAEAVVLDEIPSVVATVTTVVANGAANEAEPVVPVAAVQLPVVSVGTTVTESAINADPVSLNSRKQIREKFLKLGASEAAADCWIADFVAMNGLKNQQGGIDIAQGVIQAAAKKIDMGALWTLVLEYARQLMRIDDARVLKICEKRGKATFAELSEAQKVEIAGLMEAQMQPPELAIHVARFPFRAKRTDKSA